ncbi:MAG: hypothetical protein WBW33_12065, partial [Bryobacteraceae bacterium]
VPRTRVTPARLPEPPDTNSPNQEFRGVPVDGPKLGHYLEPEDQRWPLLCDRPVRTFVDDTKPNVAQLPPRPLFVDGNPPIRGTSSRLRELPGTSELPATSGTERYGPKWLLQHRMGGGQRRPLALL